MRLFICFMFILLLFHQGWAVERQDSIPDEVLGNWLNPVTQEWEYGFFEKFAIFQSDFWDYKTIRMRGNRLHLTLAKKGQEVDLILRPGKGASLRITSDQEKNAVYHRYPKGFIPYRTSDTVLFGEPDIALDSVTILGYYRNLDRVKPEFKENWGKYEVEADYDDLLNRDMIELKVPIDSLGRFRLKIPVYAPRNISLDWGKLWKPFVVVPGETMMLYLDMLEFQPVGDEKNNRQAYWNRSKDILFMGENARLHREMIYCPNYFGMRDMYKLSKEGGSHMDYLHRAEADYQGYMDAFAKFHSQYPTLSERCIQVMTADARYRLAYTLMQNRFNIRKKIGFDDPAYMEYVNQHFSVDSVLYYFLLSRYEGFVRDYTGYHNDLTYRYVEGVGMCKTIPDQYANALERLNEQKELKGVEPEEIKKYILLLETLQQDKESFAHLSDFEKSLQAKYDKLREEPKVQDMMSRLIKEEDLRLYDTLITCRPLRELLVASVFAEDLEHDRVPLSPEEVKLLEERVSIAEIRKPVLELQEQYQKLTRQSIRYPRSLVNTDHLKGIRDADSLWSALLAPYRGKVILLDFWGTWCEPCKDMMGRLAPLKQEFENQEIIFMYFAYASSEDSWKNVIKEFGLSGENIVHYNLPAGQQDLILKYLNVHSFPTYLLIDREGKVTDEHIAYPVDVNRLKEAIKRLLINEK